MSQERSVKDLSGLYPGFSGGGGGIRTPETLSSLTVFKTAGFNRSPTPPLLIVTHPASIGATLHPRIEKGVSELPKVADAVSPYFCDGTASGSCGLRGLRVHYFFADLRACCDAD